MDERLRRCPPRPGAGRRGGDPVVRAALDPVSSSAGIHSARRGGRRGLLRPRDSSRHPLRVPPRLPARKHEGRRGVPGDPALGPGRARSDRPSARRRLRPPVHDDEPRSGQPLETRLSRRRPRAGHRPGGRAARGGWTHRRPSRAPGAAERSADLAHLLGDGPGVPATLRLPRAAGHRAPAAAAAGRHPAGRHGALAGARRRSCCCPSSTASPGWW